MTILRSFAIALPCVFSLAEEAFSQNDTIPKKGTYLYYGQPLIEDNSFLIEEAFNQETGVIQHVSNFFWDDLDDGNFVYSYSQEIPLDNYRHQLSFTILCPVVRQPRSFPSASPGSFNNRGVGDIFINYRPTLWGKSSWALVAPRVSLIVPTGSPRDGFGAGAWGGQFNLAVTKRLTRSIVTHYNIGYTYLSKADRYEDDGSGNYDLAFEKNLQAYNLGGSLIWFTTPRFNLMVEYLANFEEDIGGNGSVSSARSGLINPGFRYAFEIGKVQIVPGASLPVEIVRGKQEASGLFIYLSIEPNYAAD
jgi:hypothetical protein